MTNQRDRVSYRYDIRVDGEGEIYLYCTTCGNRVGKIQYGQKQSQQLSYIVEEAEEHEVTTHNYKSIIRTRQQRLPIF
jgi:hypothetical protein